jgi:hypothetical protein
MRTLLSILALALVVTAPLYAVETFDDDAIDFELVFNDFPDPATGTGETFGTGPGLTVAGGKLVFYDNSNFGDVAVASLVPDGLGDADTFRVAVDVEVASIDFTQGKVGLFAFAQGPAGYGEGYTGVYAYLQELDTSGNRYRFVLARNNDDVSQELATSGEFDLTDGSPDFSLELVGTMTDEGGLAVVARITEDGRDLVAPLEGTILPEDRPTGELFGVRLNPSFNTMELALDDLEVTAGPADQEDGEPQR